MRNLTKAVLAAIMLAGTGGTAQSSGHQTKSLPITEAGWNLTQDELVFEIAKREKMIELLWGRVAAATDEAETASLKAMIAGLRRDIKTLLKLNGHIPGAAEVREILAQADALQAQKTEIEREMDRLVAAYPSREPHEQARIMERILKLSKELQDIKDKIAYAELFK